MKTILSLNTALDRAARDLLEIVSTGNEVITDSLRPAADLLIKAGYATAVGFEGMTLQATHAGRIANDERTLHRLNR